MKKIIICTSSVVLLSVGFGAGWLVAIRNVAGTKDLLCTYGDNYVVNEDYSDRIDPKDIDYGIPYLIFSGRDGASLAVNCIMSYCRKEPYHWSSFTVDEIEAVRQNELKRFEVDAGQPNQEEWPEEMKQEKKRYLIAKLDWQWLLDNELLVKSRDGKRFYVTHRLASLLYLLSPQGELAQIHDKPDYDFSPPPALSCLMFE